MDQWQGVGIGSGYTDTHTHTFEMNREGGAVCNLRVRNTQKKKLKSLLLWDPHQRASTKGEKKNVIVRMYSNIDRTGLNIFASIWLVYFHVNFASWLQSGGGALCLTYDPFFLYLKLLGCCPIPYVDMKFYTHTHTRDWKKKKQKGIQKWS